MLLTRDLGNFRLSWRNGKVKGHYTSTLSLVSITQLSLPQANEVLEEKNGKGTSFYIVRLDLSKSDSKDRGIASASQQKEIKELPPYHLPMTTKRWDQYIRKKALL